MRILVTGGAGFIGSNFICYWHQHHPDDHIINYDALTYAGNLENLRDFEQQPFYQFIKGDINDYPKLMSALSGVDTVVNFAAETHVDRSISGPSAFIQTNVVGTQILLDACREAHIKHFHHISTDEVFGSLELESEERFDENTPYDPSSPYAASKAASDHLVRAYGRTYGLPYTITNCSNNYGTYQNTEKLIPRMIIKALNNESLPIYGDGKNVRDWIHVIDHVRAIELILQKGPTNTTYTVGGNSERTNLEVASSILKLLDKSTELITFVPDRLGHDRRYAVSSDTITRELGYTPRYTFEEGLRETIAWYQDNPQWWQELVTTSEKIYT
jgi:dTDP-glucose 4,6-dehydratase